MDLSNESALLIYSIKECGSRWGLNLPIYVLRGSKVLSYLSPYIYFAMHCSWIVLFIQQYFAHAVPKNCDTITTN